LPEKKTKRDAFDIIMEVVKAHKGSASLDEVEADGQKIKPLSSGRYKGIAKAFFAQSKEGRVLPKISQKGFEDMVKYSVRRGFSHWVVKNFPEESKKVAEQLKLKLPTPASGGIYNASGHRTDGKPCPVCQVELDKRRVAAPAPTVT
jgi:hypothetical protein